MRGMKVGEQTLVTRHNIYTRNTTMTLYKVSRVNNTPTATTSNGSSKRMKRIPYRYIGRQMSTDAIPVRALY